MLFDDSLPPLELKRSARRSLAITVEKAKVVVRAPERLGQKHIHKFVESKRAWILEKYQEQLQFLAEIPVRNYIDGDILPFLGGSLTLRYVAGSSRVEREGDTLLVGDQLTHVQRGVQNWYKQQASNLLKVKADFFAESLGVSYSELKLRKTKSRWGHCTSKGVIQFNWLIVLAPEKVVDYLVVHELCHRIEFNHSAAFWSLVARQQHDYKVHQQWLKDFGHTLVL